MGKTLRKYEGTVSKECVQRAHNAHRVGKVKKEDHKHWITTCVDGVLDNGSENRKNKRLERKITRKVLNRIILDE